MTKRTLRRRLSEEGVSFEAPLDRVRRRLAERYLRERRFGVQETAFLFGYSDVSAFHRAFARWSGMFRHGFATRRTEPDAAPRPPEFGSRGVAAWRVRSRKVAFGAKRVRISLATV